MSDRNVDVDPAAVETALAELAAPTFVATRRFVNAPGPARGDDGRPAPARVRAIGADAALVWFLGAEYPLNLVVEVGREADGWRAVFAQSDPHVRVALRIVSEGLAPDAISAVLGLAPSRQAIAGRTFDGESAVPRTANLWVRDVMSDSPAPVEEKLDALLRAVEPHHHALEQLRGQAIASVAVAYHADAEAMQGVQLPASVLRRLGTLDLTLDLDLYAETLGPDDPTA